MAEPVRSMKTTFVIRHVPCGEFLCLCAFTPVIVAIKVKSPPVSVFRREIHRRSAERHGLERQRQFTNPTFIGIVNIVERTIDGSIIGGIVFEGDGKRIDMSIKGQLNRALSK